MALVFFTEDWEKLYNCTIYNYESKPVEQRLNIGRGWLYINTFVVVWILYIPCIIGMCDKALLKYSCYKLMLYLAILDLNTSIYAGFWAGFVNITGLHFCASRTAIFWIGSLNNMAWNAQSTAICLLAFNRCLNAYDKNMSKLIFGEYKIYIWMALPVLYGGRFLIVGYPGIFSPFYSALIFNPHIGFANDENNSYYVSSFNNYFTSAAVILTYLFYILLQYIVIKKSGTNQMRKATKAFGQVLIIAISLTAISIGFLIMQLGNTPQLYRDIIAYSFVVFDGLPAVIYLTMNKSIRENVKKLLFFWYHPSTTTPIVSISFNPVLRRLIIR